jgi:hypothetical protein
MTRQSTLGQKQRMLVAKLHIHEVDYKNLPAVCQIIAVIVTLENQDKMNKF